MLRVAINKIEDMSSYLKAVFPELSVSCDAEITDIKEYPKLLTLSQCVVLVKDFIGFTQKYYESVNPSMGDFIRCWMSQDKDKAYIYLYMLLLIHCDKEDQPLIDFPVRLALRLTNSIIGNNSFTHIKDIIPELKDLRNRISFSMNLHQITTRVDEFNKLIEN